MIAAEDALRRPQEVGARFVSGDVDAGSRHYRARREQILAGNEPFATMVVRGRVL